MPGPRMTQDQDPRRWTATPTASRPTSPRPLRASPSTTPTALSRAASPQLHRQHPQHHSSMGDIESSPRAAASGSQVHPRSYSDPTGGVSPSVPQQPPAAAGPSGSSTSTSARAGSWEEAETAAASGSGSTRTKAATRMPEKSMILRRREANRLAAQRFRNRKKGYQDSLEERVRVLEEERDSLLERVKALDRNSKRGESDTAWPTSSTKRPGSGTSGSAPFPPRKAGGPSTLAPTSTDESLRLSGVEAANRRLQDETKWLQEENQALRQTIDKWVEWEQNLRRSRSYDAPPYDESRQHPPHPPRSSHSSHGGAMPPTSYSGRTSHSVPPGYPHASPNPQQSPLHSPPLAYSHHYNSAPGTATSRPPLDRQSSAGSISGYPSRGAGIQLPPLRLSSLSPSMPPSYSALSGGPPPSGQPGPPGREHEPCEPYESLPPGAPHRSYSHAQWQTSPRLQPQHSRDARR